MISKEELEILIRETFEEYQSATEAVKKLRALEGTLRRAKKTQSKTSTLLEKLMAQCERLYPGLAKRLKKELHNKIWGTEEG
jgi:hypothetical protein